MRQGGYNPVFQPRPADVSSYPDINTWWRGEGVCSNAGWRLEEEMREERMEEERKKENEEKLKVKGDKV